MIHYTATSCHCTATMTAWGEFCGLLEPTDADNECKIKVGQISIFSIFAVLSSYYFGRRQCLLLRNRTQLACIRIRIFATSCLAIIPPAKLYAALGPPLDGVTPVDLLSCCFQTITMIVHVGE